MRSRITRLTAVVAVAGAALAGTLLLDSGSASAATTPPWQVSGQQDVNEVGSLTLYNAAGIPVTGGSTTDDPIVAYAVGSTVLRAGDTKATLYGYLPQSGKAPGAFSGTQLSASTVYPSAGAPSSISATLPVYTGSANDSSIADLVATLPNNDESNDGYAGLYELRLKTGANGLAPTKQYDAVDISVTGTSWQVVYPVSTGGTTTALTATTASGPVGTATTLTATVTPSTSAGSIQFADGSTSIGTPVELENGVATTSWTPSTVGAHSLTATYIPSDGSTASVGSYVFDVNKAQASLTGTWSTTAPIYGKTTTTVQAKVTVAGVKTTGTVSLFEDSTNIGSAILSSAGTATITVSSTKLVPGSYNEVLSYAGTSLISGTAATKKITVAKATSSTKIVLSASSVTTTKQIKVTITVTASGVTPTGTIDLYESTSGAKVSAVTLSAKDKGKVTVSFPLIKKTGTYSIHAKYLGSALLVSSTSTSAKLTVKKA